MKHRNSVNKAILTFLKSLVSFVKNPFAHRQPKYEGKLLLSARLMIILMILPFAINAYSQSYLLNNASNGQTITTCQGSFYDSGGAGAFYQNNENYTLTFCSGNGNSIKFDFSVCLIRTGDTLYIYDGPNSTSPLKAKFSSNTVPVSVISSGTCLTFKFVSDAIFTRDGWSASISCCLPPVTSPILPSDVYQCAGATINYSVDLHAGATYNWTVINGTPASVTGGTNNLNITWDPIGDVSGFIKVVEINTCGSKDSSVRYVDIYSLPIVDFSGLNPYSCIYSPPMTLTGSPAGGIFSGPGISGNIFTPSVAGPGTQSIIYTYTDPVTGCTNQKVIQTIINVPQIFIVGSSANSYCSGSGVNITLGGSQAGVSYQLLKNGLNDGAPMAGTGSALTWVNKQNGVYTVVGIDNISSCTNNMTGSRTIIQNPLPVPTFTAQPGGAACNSSGVTYTTQPGQSNYVWGFTGSAGTGYTILSGGGVSDNSVTLIWLTAGSKTVTINYTDSNGCTALTPASSTPTVVTLSPPPPTGNAVQNFCSEASPPVADLSATGTAIQWYAAATGGSPLISSTPLSNNTHYFASQTVNGCESITRLDVTAFIFSIPLAPVATGGTGATCTQIIAHWTASTGAASYRLDVSTLNTFASYVAGYQDLNTGNVLTYNVSGLTAGVTYYYRVRAVDFCGTSGNSLTIAYSTLPAAPVTPGAITGTSQQCAGIAGQIYSTGAVTNASTYTWNVPAGWTITGGQGTTAVTVSTGGAGQNGNITVTAGNTCGTSAASSLAVTVTPNAGLTSVIGPSPLCIGGSANFTANGVVLSGGTGAWSSSNPAVATVSATGQVTGISAGTCNIVFTITGGCGGTASAQRTVTINPNAGITSVTGTNTLCTGGTATYTAGGAILGGGTPAWSSSNPAVATVSAAGVVTGISAGTSNIIYTITGGCGGTVSAQQSVTISPNAGITSVTGTSPICIGATANYTTNGVVLSGGSGAWSSSNPAIATVSAAGLVTGISAGTSNIIFTITGGCGGTVSAQRSVTVNPNAGITSVTGTSPLCIGGTAAFTPNGVSLSGGTGAWSSSNTAVATVSTTGLVTGVSPGTCNIIFTITAGCGGTVSAQRAVTINPNASVISVAGASPVCIGGTASYTANGVVTGGGTGAWSSSNPAVATVNATGLVTGISAGTCNIIYTITGGCGGTVSAQQSLTVNPNARITSVTGASPLCIGGPANFTANGVVLSGGVGAWSSTNPAVATVSAAGLVTGISAGTSNIVFTITGGCGGTASAQRAVTINPDASIASVTGSSSLCTGGTATYTANGAVLSGGAGVWSSSNPAVATVSASGLVTGVSPGTCNIIFTITGGCGGVAVASASVTISAAPAAAISYSGSPWCTSSGPRSVTLIGTTGGTFSGAPAGLSINPSTGEITPGTSTAGTYTVSYTMASVACGNVTVSTTITIVQIPTLIIHNPAAVCSPLTVDLTAAAITSGSSPGIILTYWTDPAATIPYGTPASAAAGTYYIRGANASGCSDVKPVTVIVNPLPVVTGTQANVLCNGNTNGAIDITVTNGTGPYTYTWTGAGVVPGAQDQTGLAAGLYTVVVSDASGCTSAPAQFTISEPAVLNGTATVTVAPCPGGSAGSISLTVSGGTTPYSYLWNNGSTSKDLNNVHAGNYTVSITDAAGCKASAGVTATELAGTAVATDITCNGASNGSVNLTVENGTAPFTFMWSTGATTEDISGLTAGNYTVTISDAGGCTSVVTAAVAEPAPLNVTITSVNVLCFGASTGSVNLTVSGGTVPYSFLWSNGAITEDLNAVAAGDYEVVITDAKGCNFGGNATLTQPAEALSGSITSQTAIACGGAANGSVTVSGSGGTLPYEYSLNNGPYQVSGTFSGLNANAHIVTVRDANLCTSDVPVTLTEPAELTLTHTKTDASCPDVADGSITLSVNGGVSPYNVLWSDGDNSLSRINILPGTYSVVVTDMNGCAASADITVDMAGSEGCLEIPTIITPNGDGYNDTWIIKNIDLFPDAEVSVYNRWGERVFHTKNPLANPWDGTSGGKRLPTDSYHYVLHLNNGLKPRSGVISIIR